MKPNDRNSSFRVHNFYSYKSGQALVMLVSFIAIAVTVIASGVVNSILNAVASSRAQEGRIAIDIAESGIENAMISLLRNSSYTGETLPVGSGSATITVTGTNPKTIISTGTIGTFKRTLQVIASDSAGILTITSWKEL